MQKIKDLFKKVFHLIFGIQNNIMFILSSSFLITAIIYIILAFISQENHNAATVFIYISGFLFSIWITLTQGPDSAPKFFGGIVRLYVFLFLFILSLYNCLIFALEYSSTNNFMNIIIIIISSILLLLCSIYFVSRLMNILYFIKKIFAQIKIKLFNTTNPATTKVKALIENITAFLVAIGGLTVAIKVITESIFQVMDYFK